MRSAPGCQGTGIADEETEHYGRERVEAVADGYEYGFDVIGETGFPSGTVYPALSRLVRDGYLRSA